MSWHPGLLMDIRLGRGGIPVKKCRNYVVFLTGKLRNKELRCFFRSHCKDSLPLAECRRITAYRNWCQAVGVCDSPTHMEKGDEISVYIWGVYPGIFLPGYSVLKEIPVKQNFTTHKRVFWPIKRSPYKFCYTTESELKFLGLIQAWHIYLAVCCRSYGSLDQSQLPCQSIAFCWKQLAYSDLHKCWCSHLAFFLTQIDSCAPQWEHHKDTYRHTYGYKCNLYKSSKAFAFIWL